LTADYIIWQKSVI